MIVHPRYLIDANYRTGLIKIAIIGFWEEADVHAFAKVHAGEIGQIVAAGALPRTLVDYSASAIQPQAVVEAFRELVRNPLARSIGVACYSRGNLARLQVGRISAVRDDIRCFEDRLAALVWLNSLAPRPAACARSAQFDDRPAQPLGLRTVVRDEQDRQPGMVA